jgi:hypothetical protein
MKKRIASFNQFNKLNEAGWDSIDENYGEITVNGVTLSTTSVCYYDTPSDISYELYVNPSEKELIKIGIWSVGYLEEDEEDRRMYIYANSKELTKKELKAMGAETVRDIEDEDILDYFSADYNRKVPIDVMTAEQFIELVKSVDYNIEQQGLEDLHLIEDTAAPGYRLLGRLGAFKNK